MRIFSPRPPLLDERELEEREIDEREIAAVYAAVVAQRYPTCYEVLERHGGEIPDIMRYRRALGVHYREGCGDYVGRVHFDSTGLRASVHAWFQSGPLFGGGATFQYRREKSGWVPDGTSDSWIS